MRKSAKRYPANENVVSVNLGKKYAKAFFDMMKAIGCNQTTLALRLMQPGLDAFIRERRDATQSAAIRAIEEGGSVQIGLFGMLEDEDDASH